MLKTVRLELELPGDWKALRFPKALDDRLQELLNRQNETGRLAPHERREAKALAELADMLSLMRARAAVARQSDRNG